MRLARTLGVAIVAAVAVTALAPAAMAHNVKRSPGVGDASSTWIFRGSAWQPGGGVRVEYYASDGATRPYKTFSFTTGDNGKFIFRFALPVATAAYGLNQRMCFTQFDTRAQFAKRSRASGTIGRRFRKCKRFYVEPPTARFWPSSGPPGTPFLLVTSGWYPNQRLTLRLTRPDAVIETYDLGRTRRRGAYVAVGPPFGSVFVRKGATLKVFPGDPDVQQGTYVGVVRAASGGAEIRTAVTVTPP